MLLSEEKSSDGLFEILLEDFEHSLWTVTGSRFNGRSRCSRGETYRKWIEPDDPKLSGKCLPYGDEQSFRDVVEVCQRLSRDPFIIAGAQKLVSYVVASGHKYEVVKREGANVADATVRRVSASVKILMESTSLGNKKGWFAVQEESYDRLIRGEFFRRWFDVEGVLHVRFVEPLMICQPPDIKRINNIEDIPPEVRAQFHRSEPPGEYGIVSMEDDVQWPLGYWKKKARGGSESWDFIPANEMQHSKMMGDCNDPRGWGLFYSVASYVEMVKDVVKALTQLILIQSKYAAIHVYHDGVQKAKIRMIGETISKEEEEQEGPPPPGVVQAKQFTVDLPGTRVRASSWIEVIQALQRIIGGVADLAEFMITGDANTGNRSSLVAAEGPFDRRIRREQKQLAAHDVDLLWHGVGIDLRWSQRRLKEVRRLVEIVPDPPAAVSRDWHKLVGSLLALATPEAGRDAVIGTDSVRRMLDLIETEQPARSVVQGDGQGDQE